MRFLQEFTSYLAFRTFFIFASTAFSILVVMLLVNIITIDEVSKILSLSPEATAVLKTVFSRIQEVTGNLLDIISQLLNKLFGWAGVDIDLHKIKIDPNQPDLSHGAAIDPSLKNAPIDSAESAKKLIPLKSTGE